MRLNPLFVFRGNLIVSACENYLIGARADSTTLFRADSFEELTMFQKAKGVVAAVFLPDQEHVVLAEYMHQAGMYRIDSGELVGGKWKIVKKSADVVALLSVPGRDELLHASWDGPPRVLDHAGKTLRRIGPIGGPDTLDVAFSPSGRSLAVVSETAVSWFDWPSESLKKQVNVFEDMEWDDDEARHARITFWTETAVVVGNNAGAVRLFDLKANECIHQFEFAEEEVYDREFELDPEAGLAGFSDGGSLRFFRLNPIQCLGSIALHKDCATVFGFSKRHKTLAVGAGESGRVYNTAEVLESLKEPGT